jgi:hypothetical protein
VNQSEFRQVVFDPSRFQGRKIFRYVVAFFVLIFLLIGISSS